MRFFLLTSLILGQMYELIYKKTNGGGVINVKRMIFVFASKKKGDKLLRQKMAY